MMLHVTADVLLKYFFNMPIQGTLEITAYYYMVAIVVMPMAFVELTRQSIAVDLFYQMAPRKLQVALTFIVLLASAIGYGGLAWITWPDALISFGKREIVMGSVNIVIWPARFLLPIALFITTLVCIMHMIRMFIDPEVRARLIAIHTADPDAEVH